MRPLSVLILPGITVLCLLSTDFPIGKSPVREEDKSLQESDERRFISLSQTRQPIIGQEGKPRIHSYTDPFAGEMVAVKGGSYQMGSMDWENTEQPVHTVTVDDFWIGKYEVTQAQWQAIMGFRPGASKVCDQCPVENVSWNDVQVFLRKLNEKTGDTYRLPSEAEWEYAAGGGSEGRMIWPGTSKETELETFGWFSYNSGETTHPVGQKHPNRLGLYDMAGNVSEWCEDDWHETYLGAPVDGQAWVERPRNTVSTRVFRGGAWCYSSIHCRVARRYEMGPSLRSSYLGFRLARQK